MRSSAKFWSGIKSQVNKLLELIGISSHPCPAILFIVLDILVAICFLSEDESLANENCNNCFDYFDNNESFIVLGPSCLNKLRDQFRYRIVLKATDKEKMIEEVWKWYQSQQYNRNKLNIQIDVDPYILDQLGEDDERKRNCLQMLI